MINCLRLLLLSFLLRAKGQLVFNEWSNQISSSYSPAAVQLAITAVSSAADNMFVYGGQSWEYNRIVYFYDVWILNLASLTWSQGTGGRTAGTPSLSGGTGQVLRHSNGTEYFVAFGGINALDEASAATVIFDTSSWQFQPTLDGPISSRVFASSVAIRNHTAMLVYGGFGDCHITIANNCTTVPCTRRHDTWLFTIDDFKWTLIDDGLSGTNETTPPATVQAPLVLTDEHTVVMYAGQATQVGCEPFIVPPVNTLWTMDTRLPVLQWRLLPAYVEYSFTSTPVIWGSGAAWIDNKLTLFGLTSTANFEVLVLSLDPFQEGPINFTVKAPQGPLARIQYSVIQLSPQSAMIFDGFSSLVTVSAVTSLWIFHLRNDTANALAWTPASSQISPTLRQFQLSAQFTWTPRVSSGSVLAIFGGLSSEAFEAYDDLWFLFLKDYSWKHVGNTGSACTTVVPSHPTPRYAGQLLPLTGTVLLLFGGFLPLSNSGLNGVVGVSVGDQVWYGEVDEEGIAWHCPVATIAGGGTLPKVAAGIAFVLPYESTSNTREIVFFGGYDEVSLELSPNDNQTYLMQVDVATRSVSWKVITTPSHGTPNAMAFSSSAMLRFDEYNATRGCFFGGYLGGGAVSREMWCYDAVNALWVPIATESGPLGRMYGTSASLGTRFFVTGGSQPDTLYSFSNLWSYDTRSQLWLQLTPSNNILPTYASLSSAVTVSASTGAPVLSIYAGADRSSPVLGMVIGCPPGYSSEDDFFANSTCLPCPIGTYGPVAGLIECYSCPGVGSTNYTGASSVFECYVCQNHTCNYNGNCSITDPSTGSFQCVCASGYYAFDDCSLPIEYILIGVSVFLFLVILTFCVMRRRARKSRERSSIYKKLLDDAEQNLDVQIKQVRDLERSWHIELSDIEFEKQLDAGAFGEVYLAEWMGRKVAVKRLKLAVLESDSSCAQDFEREVRFMRTLRHANVTFFYGAGADAEEVPFLVTEFLSQGSLYRILHDASVVLDWAQRTRFALDAAKGMRYLHSQTPPCIHRDLKSGNLLVSDLWVVKVCDFGTARLVDTIQAQENPIAVRSNNRWALSLKGSSDRQSSGGSSSRLTTGSSLMTRGVGTLLWTAPEVLRGDAYTSLVDVYSFAIVLWELSTRTLPYNDIEQMWDIEKRVVDEDLRPTLPSNAPLPFVSLMTRCWATLPSERMPFTAIVDELDAMEETCAGIERDNPHSSVA